MSAYYLNVETEELLEEVPSDLVEENLVGKTGDSATTVHAGIVLWEKKKTSALNRLI